MMLVVLSEAAAEEEAQWVAKDKLFYLDFEKNQILSDVQYSSNVKCYREDSEWKCYNFLNLPISDFKILCDEDGENQLNVPSCKLQLLGSSKKPLKQETPDAAAAGKVEYRSVQRLHFELGKRTRSTTFLKLYQLLVDPASDAVLSSIDCANVGFENDDVVWACTSPDLKEDQRLVKAIVSCEYLDSAHQYILEGSCCVLYKVQNE